MNKSLVIGKRVLITTDAWFVAPDGYQYRSVWGTINGIFDSEETLGVKTNERSTNWYVLIGDMLIAGCQIHYAIECDGFRHSPVEREIENAGQVAIVKNMIPLIYNANVPYKTRVELGSTGYNVAHEVINLDSNGEPIMRTRYNYEDKSDASIPQEDNNE